MYEFSGGAPFKIFQQPQEKWDAYCTLLLLLYLLQLHFIGHQHQSQVKHTNLPPPPSKTCAPLLSLVPAVAPFPNRLVNQ